MDNSQTLTMFCTIKEVSTKQSIPNTEFSNYRTITFEINSKMATFQSPYVQLSRGFSYTANLLERDTVKGLFHGSKEKGLNKVAYGVKQTPVGDSSSSLNSPVTLRK